MNETPTEMIRDWLLTANKEELIHDLEFIHPMDLLQVLHENEEYIEQIVRRLPDDVIGQLLDYEEDEDKYELLMHLSATRQKSVLKEMSSDEIVNFVEELDEEEKQDVFSKMNKTDLAEVNELLAYPEDSAGAAMTTEFISIRENKTILKTIEYLHKACEDAEMAYYLYVIDKQNHLKGVVSLRDIVQSSFETRIAEITNPHVISCHVNDDQEVVAQIFEKYDFLMLPVVDDDNIIRGVITVDDVIDIIQEETTEDIHRLAGLNEEEKVDGRLTDSIKSRLPWLCINLVTAFLASSVVSAFSDTIQAVVALAAINPIIAGMGGNAGTQSLTLIVRGIALGEITKENAKKILLKELGVGAFCGIVLGLLISIVCMIFYGNPYLGLVVGLAMLSNLVIAVVAGFAVPNLLNYFHIDPALASSVFVTTCTDVCGFFIFLSLATLFLPYLM